MRLIDAFLDNVPNTQRLVDYDGRTDGQPVYIGRARISASQDDTVWLIHYTTYDANGYFTSVLSKEGAWSSRALLFV